MRLSALSCYSPDALDTLDWDRSTAWKTVGGAETKRTLKDFTLNCNTATRRERLTPDVHYLLDLLEAHVLILSEKLLLNLCLIKNKLCPLWILLGEGSQGFTGNGPRQ